MDAGAQTAQGARRRPWHAAIIAAVAIAAFVGLACDGSPTRPDPVCGEETPVGPGAIVSERLESGDRRFAGALIDYYSLQLPRPADLSIELSSADFDPLLLLFEEQGDVAQAFDSLGVPPGTEETAAMTRSLPAGCHLIGTSSWALDGTGAYTLSVDEAQTPQ